MKLTINGKEKEFEQASLTVTELLKAESVDMPEMVTVEHNGDILERETFDTKTVKDGDSLEFLYFMGGGISTYLDYARHKQLDYRDEDYG